MRKFTFDIFAVVIIAALLTEFFYFRIFSGLDTEISKVQMNSFLLSLLIYLGIIYLDRSAHLTFFTASDTTKKLAFLFIFPQIALLIYGFGIDISIINVIAVVLTIMLLFLPLSEYYLTWRG